MDVQAKKVTFANEAELDEAFSEHGEYALAFVSNVGEHLIIGETEDGECFYQGLPMAEDEYGKRVDPRRGWARDLLALDWPLTLMVSAANGTVKGR